MGELLQRGATALREGDWESARQHFEAVLAEDGADPDALLGLGNALWWTRRVAETPPLWERAYAGFRRRSDTAQAVVVAVNLSLTYGGNFGNPAAARGWAARAARLADDLGVPVLCGWVLITRSRLLDEPAEAQTLIDEARAIATECNDRDLELCALAALGSSMVDEGRIAEGMPLLDEAMAGTVGQEYEEPDTAVFTSCTLVQTCYRCADYARVVQWVRALRGFVERYGSLYVNSLCRAHYGAVLVATGDWPAAEIELTVALELAGDALPAVRAEASAFLAELRLAQGRAEEALELVEGLEDQDVTAPVVAAAQLVLGDPASAASVAARALAAAGDRRLLGARAAEVLGHARLALGDRASPDELARQLTDAGQAHDCALLVARGERLRGRVLAATGSAREARRHLERAVAAFTHLEMPYEAACARTLLAESLDSLDGDAAVEAARRAFVTFQRLGATRDADFVAAWLRDRGATPRRMVQPADEVLTGREQEVLELVGGGLSNPEIADRLYLSRRTVEHHVARILTKLGLRNRTEAASYLARHAAERRSG